MLAWSTNRIAGVGVNVVTSTSKQPEQKTARGWHELCYRHGQVLTDEQGHSDASAYL